MRLTTAAVYGSAAHWAAAVADALIRGGCLEPESRYPVDRRMPQPSAADLELIAATLAGGQTRPYGIGVLLRDLATVRTAADQAAARAATVLEELHRKFEAIHGWRGPSATATGKRALPEGYGAFRLAYLPERHYARGLADGLLDATYPLDHQHYRHELQEAARNNAEIGKVCIVPLDIEGLLAFAERQGADPARRSTRLAYVGEVDTRGDIPWPPERNAPCWCGSGGKYKKCCGRPGFRQIVVPDRGQAIVRVELAGTDPLVWRRVAVPSRIRLDLLHDVLAAEMGWHGDHMYAFEIEGGQICDPRFSDDAPTADDCHLPELASEPGHTFIYRYDFDDDWVHTVTVEQIVAVDPAANEPRSLAAHGACPPQDCGGVPGYRRLLAALADPDHPRHDEALQRLGPHWDASTPTTG